jgi:fatty-acyl-CoA synthase
MRTMMDVPLTIDRIADRAERYLGGVEIVSRRPDKSLHRTTLGAVIARARRLARALIAAGIKPGDRVATLMWNHAEHLEAYFGIPLAGAVVHTLNLRLHPDEIAYIAADARDRILIADESLLTMADQVCPKTQIERVIVSQRDYEDFLASAPAATELPALAEDDPLGVCYTSGTTGRPKGVVYTHRSTLLHTIVSALPDALALSRADTLLPVVPMFHVNAWGLPYTAALVGAKLVFPGPHLDPASLLDLMERERVTVAAGVPTIWLGIREALDAAPTKPALAPGLRMIVGGSAAPEQLIRDFDRQGLTLLHAWGMTETSPIGLVSRLSPELAAAPDDVRYRQRAKQGVPPPLVDIRVRNDAGDVPADGATSGELLVRGPWIAASYANQATPERWTDDGFFRTGDVARIDEHGFVQLTDRVADLIKSGGEWIASQELENALMGHPAVREAAVIGVPHPKWSERPIAAIVFKPGLSATPDELRAHLAPRFAKFWLPDAFVVVDSIPRTSAGKFKKTELRERFRDWSW